MARLYILFDKQGRIEPLPADARIPQAMIELPEGLEGRDVYEIARRLAELLLEQIT